MTDRETEAALDGAVDTTGEDRHWQLRLLDEVLAEEAANEELRRTDPEAYQAKMEAQLPTNTCCFCRETFRGTATTRRRCSKRARHATLATAASWSPPASRLCAVKPPSDVSLSHG